MIHLHGTNPKNTTGEYTALSFSSWRRMVNSLWLWTKWPEKAKYKWLNDYTVKPDGVARLVNALGDDFSDDGVKVREFLFVQNTGFTVWNDTPISMLYERPRKKRRKKRSHTIAI